MKIIPPWVRGVLILFVVTRLILFGFAAAWQAHPGARNTPGPSEPIWHGDTGGYPKWIEAWRKWDALWFISLARDGYQYRPDRQSNITIYPLYPALMRVGGRQAPCPAVAGIVISNLALLAACLILYAVFLPRVGHRGAMRGLAALLLFPSAFVYSGIYAESVLLLTTAAAWLLAERGRWPFAAVAAALAVMTRFTGILILVPLAWMWWRAERRAAGSAVWLLLPPAALAAHFAHLRTHTRSLAAYFLGQSHWGKTLSDPLSGLFWDLTSGFHFEPMLNVACAVGFLALGVIVWRRHGGPAGLFVLLGTLVPMCQSKLQGIPRYVAVLFPAFLIPAALGEKHPWLFRLWCGVSAGILLYSFYLFSDWRMAL